MSESIHEARLGVLQTVAGVLLDLADFENVEESEKPALVEQMDEVAEMLLDVLGFDVVSYDEATGEVVAKLILAYE